MTTPEQHHKHPKIVKPSLGKYARTEWAIYGTGCGQIETLAGQIIEALKNDFHVAWVDADHKVSAEHFTISREEKNIEYHWEGVFNDYDHKSLLHPADVALINGNHYPASRQIVVIDSKKEASLQRRIDQLNQVDALILMEEDQKVFDFVQKKLKEQKNQVPVFAWNNTGAVVEMIKGEIQKSVPKLKALVLAGGKSQRMGRDKSQLEYYGIAHEIHLAKICKSLGLETWISKRDTAAAEIEGFPVLPDRFLGLGPFGAICSAFLSDPNAAWLVVACDLPFLDEATLENLIQQRRPANFATAIKSVNKPFPEPLITIYEPKAYPRLLAMLAQGVSCPRKFLINSDVQLIELEDDRVISNVNTKEEYQEAKKSMSK